MSDSGAVLFVAVAALMVALAVIVSCQVFRHDITLSRLASIRDILAVTKQGAATCHAIRLATKR